jgi:hypothetical protein
MTGISHRAMSLLLVLLLHALLLFALLRLIVAPQAILATRERLLEMIIDTSRTPTPVPIPPRQRPAPTRPQRGGVPSGPMPSFAPPAEAPDIRGLGQAILGCAPENLSNLTPEQRAHCPNAFTRPDDSAVLEPQSHLKDPGRRAAEMAAKNRPGRVPCSYVAVEKEFGYQVPAASLDCLLDSITGPGLAPLNGLEK